MNAPTPVFYGKVSERGLILLDTPIDYGRHLQRLAGERVEVVVRKRKTKRSNQANAFYWAAVVHPLAEHLGYEDDELHEVMAMRFLRIEDCPVTGVPRRKRTPKTDTAEFSDYVERCIRLAAELGVVVEDRA
jgi:hypothetical protein